MAVTWMCVHTKMYWAGKFIILNLSWVHFMFLVPWFLQNCFEETTGDCDSPKWGHKPKIGKHGIQAIGRKSLGEKRWREFLRRWWVPGWQLYSRLQSRQPWLEREAEGSKGEASRKKKKKPIDYLSVGLCSREGYYPIKELGEELMTNTWKKVT